MAIFNSYVSLPEGILYSQQKRGLEKVTMISKKKHPNQTPKVWYGHTKTDQIRTWFKLPVFCWEDTNTNLLSGSQPGPTYPN